jgi:hypothetical protein
VPERPAGRSSGARPAQFELLNQPRRTPSLQFEPVGNGRYGSVRCGLRHRALGVPVTEGVQWFWIGSHADYDSLVG